MNTISRTVLLVLAAALPAGALGYAVALLSRAPAPMRAAAGEVRDTNSSESGSGFSSARVDWEKLPQVPLPMADFQDREGFDRCVSELVAGGLAENHAQWLALSLLAERDFSSSFQIARGDSKLLVLWASGAAQTNPRDAFALLLTAPGKDASAAWTPYFSALGKANPALGLELIEQTPGEKYPMHFKQFFEAWGQSAPEAAATRALSVASLRQRHMAMYGALHAWKDRDAEGMMAWAARQRRQVLNAAFGTLYDHRGVRDPAAVLEMLRRYPDAALGHLAGSVAESLAQKGAEGWRQIDALPAGPLRDDLVTGFARRFARQSPEAAWALALELPAEERAKFFHSAAYAFAEKRPADLAAQLARDGIDDARIRSALFSQWSQADPRAALAWARETMKGNALGSALAGPFREWAAKDPQAAVAEWERLPPGLRARVLPSLVGDWAEKAPQAALEWAGGLEPLDRRHAVDGILSGWSTSDPVAAAEAALSLPGEKSEHMLSAVANRLVNKDPAYAAAWIARVPEKQGPKVAESAVRSWASRDAVAAANYLGTLAQGTVRDGAVNGFVQSTSDLDPATAAEWAESIQEAEVRKSALRNALRSWRTTEPGAARSFAEKLPELELRGELLRLVETGK